MKRHFVLRATASLAVLATGISPAFAQDSGNAEDSGNEDIIVTAQKRAERLQDVPISIAAFTDEALTTNNIMSVQDLNRVATNFSATRLSQTAGLRLTVRGVGAPGNSATEPSVAAFVDGVYVPRPGSIIGNFLDIEGVEILRGPQGTLFGRNASVGAISFRSATPADEFSGEVSAEAGNGDRYKLSSHLNVPLGPDIALRVAGMGSWFNGYWHNNLDDKTYGGSDDYAGRATLKAGLGNLTWLLRADYSEARGDGFIPSEFKFNSVSEAQAAAFTDLQIALGGSAIDNVLFDRNVNQQITADYHDRHWGVSSDASLDLDGYTLRLINSYRDWNMTQLDGDTIFTPIRLSSRGNGYTSKSQNHELQFNSPQNQLLGGKLEFVAGLYYFQEDYTLGERLHFAGEFCNALVPEGELRDACNDTLAAGGGVDATVQDFSQSIESIAAYGQATFKIVEPLSLTLGGRWSRDDKDALYIQDVSFPFAGDLRAPENAALELTDDRFTWRASLNYKPDEDILVFLNYSTGYKSGGFNSGAGSEALGQDRIFARETVQNYELGAKTSWLDGALTVNATLYRMDIAGYQDRSFDGVSFVMRNAGNLRHQGVEFDAIMKPSRNFVVNASVAYLDSSFTSYPNASGLPGCAEEDGVIAPVCLDLPDQGQTQDLKGTRANYAPEWTGNVGATWSGEIGSSGMTWSLNGNVAFTSDINSGGVTDNNIQNMQDGYALLGARFAVHGPDDRWSVALFGSNLTDEGYCVAHFYQVLDSGFGLTNGIFPGSTGVRCHVANPRTYGASATFRF